MFNGYYQQPQYGQAPATSNNPFHQLQSTNPFRQTPHLPQHVSHDLVASHTGDLAYSYGQEPHTRLDLYSQPLAPPALQCDTRASSPSPSNFGYAPVSHAGLFQHHLSPATAAQPQATGGTQFSVAGQFGHVAFGAHEHTTSGCPPHTVPPAPNPLLSTGIFGPVAPSPITPSYQPLSRRASSSSSSSSHSPSTSTPSPSPWTSTSSGPAPSLRSSSPVPTRVGSPGIMSSRRGSPSRHVRSIRDAPVRFQPSMRESGRPGTLWMCPGDTIINYCTTWHVLYASGMQLTCCPPCYISYATGSSLGFAVEELAASRCMFHTKRAQALLLAGETVGLTAYFRIRTRIKDCPRAISCTRTAGITWYRAINGPVDMLCCEACFEDHVKASAWVARFELVTNPPEGTAVCGFALESVRDGYIKLAPDHWDEWRRLVDRRRVVRPCTSSDVKAGSRKWYTITPAITGLVICEACYLDKVTPSRFATHFVPYVVGNPNDLYMCDFSSLYFVFPFVVADETNAWGKFQTAASRVMDCAMAQMNGGRQQFWGLAPGLMGRESDWDVCEKCYASLFEPYGFDRFLQPRPPSNASRRAGVSARQCDMCPRAPRKTEMLARLQEAAYAGVFSHFSDWARRAAGARNHGRMEGLCYTSGEEVRRAY